MKSLRLMPAALLCCAALVSACNTQSNAPTVPDPATVSRSQMSPSQARDVIFSSINQERRKRGLSPLRYNAKLASAAQSQASYIVSSRRFSHTGRGGSSVLRRVFDTGYKACVASENLSMQYPNIQGAMRGWMESPKHRTNMLHKGVSEVGVGVAPGAVYVAVFATPCPEGMKVRLPR